MPKFADVKVGDTLGPLTKTMDRLRLVQYAAGSGDFNPLHYDADHAQAKAIGDNIVHGRMKWSSLGQLVSDWVGGDAWVRSVSCQYRGMDPQGTEWAVKGIVTDKREVDGRKEVEIEVWTENAAEQRTTPGRAVVVLNA